LPSFSLSQGGLRHRRHTIPAQPMALQPGSRLGIYEVLGPLGAGGMGEVYRARDRNLGRDVAIKVLPAAFANDPSRSAPFHPHARILAAINHPALTPSYCPAHS